jgi:hypothetical protein
MKTLNKRGPSIDLCGTPLWMSAQLLRILLTFICCFLFNKYDFGVFPDSLKKAQVTPLHKKNDPLSKTNYRPVSVLPVFSKTFEKVFETQLSDFFDTIFDPFLCAFRRGHGCQTTLLRLLEDWREALDKNYYIASVLMDLSKAFEGSNIVSK